jgi:hypothetical protein
MMGEGAELVHEAFQTHVLDAFEDRPHLRRNVVVCGQQGDSGHGFSFAFGTGHVETPVNPNTPPFAKGVTRRTHHVNLILAPAPRLWLPTYSLIDAEVVDLVRDNVRRGKERCKP